MDAKCAQEKFVDWLSRRLVAAGQGENDSELDVEPAGKYWLGRLQSEQAVAQSVWGDRGERLEPCAVGIRVRPASDSAWNVKCTVSACVWLWNKPRQVWRKSSPLVAEVELTIAQQYGISQHARKELKEALSVVTGHEGLEARIDAEVSRARDGKDELALTLVNCSPAVHPHFRDTRIYQCRLAISGVATEPFLLEALDDSFRYDRQVPAYGINCGVTQIDEMLVTDDAVAVDRTRPTYWNVSAPMPSFKFDDLVSCAIESGEELLEQLRAWGELHWSDGVLQGRALDEMWNSTMKAEAELAAKAFEEECARIARGVKLLVSDKKLAASFAAMHRSMSRSANGRYDAWRPFQYGFLLANLPCIVEHVREAEIVDLVWFATGGGKTETYLGLILTACFYDRLTGKTTGITAWSRFPLRMLSLQQTQRFANAVGAAELVRRQLRIGGDSFSLGFFVGQSATPNRINEDARRDEPDPDDEEMPKRFQILDQCPFCHEDSIVMAFDRLHWKLEHRCGNLQCPMHEEALPFFVVDEEIYRFLPTVIVGTLDKAASISIQAAMRGFVGPPLGVCEKDGHGYIYASRSARPNGCLVPGCKSSVRTLPISGERFGPSFRLQDELHLLRDSLGAVDSHYEALFDGLQGELCGRKPKILASSATLTGYERQVDTLYRRKARVFPVPPPRSGVGFWTSDSTTRMRRFVAIAPRGVTIEYTVDRLLTELQIAIRELANDPERTCEEIGIDVRFADELVSLYGTNVVYGNTLRDLEAVTRSIETQVLVDGRINTASLTGKSDFSEVRDTLNRLERPEENLDERVHIISASSMMSHGVDIDRLNTMVMLGIPLTAAEFIQSTARVGRRHEGLVFVVHKMGRERDAGVFRSFRQFVEQGDRFVEPIPITRRSRRVLGRTLAGLELARLLMIHEPNSANAITTVKAFRKYVADGSFDIEHEIFALIATLGLDSELDDGLRQDLVAWFDELSRNIQLPPTDARFLSDLSPTGSAMLSLRDVDVQAPVIGNLF